MNKRSFEKFYLSNDSLKKIRDIPAATNKELNFNPAWLLIGGKSWYKENQRDPPNADTDDTLPKEIDHENQFYFTQAAKPIYKEKIETGLALTSVDKVIVAWIESLEQSSSGRHDFQSLKTLSNEQLSKVFEALKDKLSENGVFNLCNSVLDMDTEQSLIFLPTFCTKFLLPKIIEFEKNFSPLVKKGICECAIKFPDEIQNLIFTGIFNSDPKNTCIIIALVKTFGSQKYSSLLSQFANHTRKLKKWHFPILEIFSSIKADENSRKKLLKLYLNEAMTFSKDTAYARLVQTFAKTNAPFSKEEKLDLEEIAALNQTVYKKLIEKHSKT